MGFVALLLLAPMHAPLYNIFALLYHRYLLKIILLWTVGNLSKTVTRFALLGSDVVLMLHTYHVKDACTL